MFFKKAVIVALSFVILGAILAVRLVDVGRRHEERYHRLMVSAELAGETAKTLPATSTQHRKGVKKTMLFSEKGQRLRWQLYSEESDLVISHKDNKTEVVEHLKGVICNMQEELYYQLDDGREAVEKVGESYLLREADPAQAKSWVKGSEGSPNSMHRLRHFEAEAATYYHKTDLLVAEHVKLASYLVPGHPMVDSVQGIDPLMHGVAKSVQCSMMGAHLYFKAYHLKATLNSPRGFF